LRRRRRNVVVSSLWNKLPHSKVRTENGPRKARTESSVHPRLLAGEQALVECLENLAACGNASWEAAHALKPVRQVGAHRDAAPTAAAMWMDLPVLSDLAAPCHHRAWQALLSSALGVKGRFKSCAIVGNSGNMLLEEYGQYIDAHDVVVRRTCSAVSRIRSSRRRARHLRF
jgi:hypothetical protein